MANEYKDVLRLEGTETGLLSIQRAGQDAFATDTKKLLHKWAGGGVSKYSEDGSGLTGVGANDVSYSFGGWSVNTVEDALDDLRATTVATVEGSGNLWARAGITGVGSTGTSFPYSYRVENSICYFTFEAETLNYGNANTTLKLIGWPAGAYPASVARVSCQVYDAGVLLSARGLGSIKITPLSGATGAETGIPISILTVDPFSGYPEYAESGWSATGIKGIPHQTIIYPMT